MSKESITRLYRYEGYDEYSVKTPLVFNVLRETEYGWWVATGGNKEKWVSKGGKKRFAYPTKKEAMVNYIARKRSQIQHCINMINLAETALYHCGRPQESELKDTVYRLEGLT